MSIVNSTLEIHGRPLAFRFPDSGNMREHLQSIFSGAEYPLPPLPEGYRIETVVDIGANVGAAAIWFSSVAVAGARIVCFEPARENVECLRLNVQPLAAEVYGYGLFSEEREAVLHLGFSQCMQHSIVASCETGEGTEVIQIKQASEEFARLQLERVSILKIDTEGCEVAILADLGPARLEGVDIVYVEWHSEADRRAIDGMLGERFLMAHAVANVPHRGRATYLAKDIAEGAGAGALRVG